MNVQLQVDRDRETKTAWKRGWPVSVGQCIAFNTAISMKPVPHRSRTRATGTTRSVRGRVKIVELGRGSALFAGGTTRNSTRQLRIPACVPSIYLTHVAQLSVPWPGYDFGSVEGSFACENPKNRRNCQSIAVAPRIYATGRDRGSTRHRAFPSEEHWENIVRCGKQSATNRSTPSSLPRQCALTLAWEPPDVICNDVDGDAARPRSTGMQTRARDNRRGCN